MYLTKNYSLCTEIWDSIVEVIGADPDKKEYKTHELNEIYLLRSQIFEEMGEFKKGIKFVAKNKRFLVDDVRRNELLVRLNIKAGWTRKSIEYLEELVRLNSCNSVYYEQILEANSVDLKNESQIMEVLDKYIEV